MRGELRRYARANARVRALLVSLLGRAGLEALSTYPTADAILDALQRTAYGEALASSSARSAPLLDRLARVGRALLDMLADPERAFLRQYLLRYEVENLKILIRAVHRRWPWEHVARYVLPLPGIGTLDSRALADARDLRDLIDRLDGTAYGPPLRGAMHRLQAAGPFALEVAVDLDYYDRLWAATATLEASDTALARRLLGTLFDILNLGWIARYRDAIGCSAEEILNYTLSQGRWVNFEVRRALAEDPNLAWDVALARTPYAALLAEVPVRGWAAASTALWRFLATEAQRTLTGYPFQIGVPLGFLFALETEIRDLHVLLTAKSIGAPGSEAIEALASVRH